MASLARDRLPAVGEQLRRSRPALAWAEVASPTAAPRPRQPSTPRGNPCAAARALRRDVPGRPSAGGDALPRSDALGPLGIRRPVGLKLPTVTGIDEPRPGSGTSGQRVAEAFTAPELPRMEPAASTATGGQTSGTESTSDLSGRSLSPGEAGARLRRTSATAREEERPPSRRRSAQPTSATSTAASPVGPGACRGPPGLDESHRVPRCVHAREPARPPRPRGEAPSGARPGCAGRSASARVSRLPRSSGA
ncbi:unnamed protein product [Prorocentrum cordatum]|uniref:Uncharacterized protein n=1 Tax=Prorocentrum cordatum TaxID=2364126 RepID=A0ABN9W583_9DINO|nr:unnamed protein product [Polarella glacialis]